MPRGFVVVLGLVALRNGGALLPVQSGRDDLVLIIGWRNMVPSVLTPDVCVLCEKSVRRDHDQSGVREISAVTDLDPNGGFSAVTSWTDDAVLGAFVCSPAAMTVPDARSVFCYVSRWSRTSGELAGVPESPDSK